VRPMGAAKIDEIDFHIGNFVTWHKVLQRLPATCHTPHATCLTIATVWPPT